MGERIIDSSQNKRHDFKSSSNGGRTLDSHSLLNFGYLQREVRDGAHQLKALAIVLLAFSNLTPSFQGVYERRRLGSGAVLQEDVVFEFDMDDIGKPDFKSKLKRRPVMAPGSSLAKDSSKTEGFVDTHCHLDCILPRLSRQSRDDVRKAEAAGQTPPRIFRAGFEEWRSSLQGPERSFEGCVHIGCSADTFEAAASFLKHDGVHGAFGIHPLNAEEWCDAVEHKLMDMMKLEKVVALGECGLDYFDKNTRGQLKDIATRELQRRVFARQMDLAVHLDVPLVVHCRDAEDDTLELMTKHLPVSHPVHVHCFTSSLSLAQALLEHFTQLYIGFTGVVTFKNARKIKKVVQQVPLERILLETDGPYMAPEPFRGRIAHPGHVVYVADGIAALKGVSRQEVLRVCRKNARSIYGF